MLSFRHISQFQGVLIAGYGRCLQRSCLGRSSPTEDTSSRNSSRACSVKVSNSFMGSRLRWRTNWCLCGTRSCWGKDTSSSALTNCSRTRPTLFTRDTARYTTLSWTCVLPLQHTASLRTSRRHCRCMWKNQGSWNFFHAKLIPNSSIAPRWWLVLFSIPAQGQVQHWIRNAFDAP